MAVAAAAQVKEEEEEKKKQHNNKSTCNSLERFSTTEILKTCFSLDFLSSSSSEKGGSPRGFTSPPLSRISFQNSQTQRVRPHSEHLLYLGEG